jgi:hypothetical protein
MSKVNASFEELTHRGARKRHKIFSGWSTAGLSSGPWITAERAENLGFQTPERLSGFLPEGRNARV